MAYRNTGRRDLATLCRGRRKPCDIATPGVGMALRRVLNLEGCANPTPVPSMMQHCVSDIQPRSHDWTARSLSSAY